MVPYKVIPVTPQHIAFPLHYFFEMFQGITNSSTQATRSIKFYFPYKPYFVSNSKDYNYDSQKHACMHAHVNTQPF